MSRVALLPTAGCPFANAFYFHFFERYWQNDVDRLFIHFNSPVEKEVADFCRGLVTRNDKVVFLYKDDLLYHGNALTPLFEASNEDYILFIEEDAPILQHGVVDKYFKMVENEEYNAVGVPRGCCSSCLTERVVERFGPSVEDKLQVNFWPCFFFCKRGDVEKTDKNFGGKTFNDGDYIKELDWTVPAGGVASDTFVWFSVQMRSLWLSFKHATAKGNTGHDIEEYESKTGQFAEPLEWLHVGSLSLPMYTDYVDGNNIPIGLRKRAGSLPVPPKKYVGVDQQFLEMKAGWKAMIMERFWSDLEPIAEFRDLYKDAFYQRCYFDGLDMDRVKKRALIYKELLKL